MQKTEEFLAERGLKWVSKEEKLNLETELKELFPNGYAAADNPKIQLEELLTKKGVICISDREKFRKKLVHPEETLKLIPCFLDEIKIYFTQYSEEFETMMHHEKSPIVTIWEANPTWCDWVMPEYRMKKKFNPDYNDDKFEFALGDYTFEMLDVVSSALSGLFEEFEEFLRNNCLRVTQKK